MCVSVNTHWLRNANRYLITTRVGRGVVVRIFRMERALSYRLSVPVEGCKQGKKSHVLKQAATHEKTPAVQIPRETRVLNTASFPEHHFSHPLPLTHLSFLASSTLTCTLTDAEKHALTDAGDEIVELLLWEKRVVQVTEVHFQHARHRVNVMVILLVSQGVVA